MFSAVIPKSRTSYVGSARKSSHAGIALAIVRGAVPVVDLPVLRERPEDEYAERST